MTAQPIATVLRELRACDQAREWASPYSSDWQRAWAECPRGDWMLWLCSRLHIDRRWIVMAAVWCAVPALRHVPRGEHRPHDALWCARGWALGERTDDEVRAAAAAARSAARSAAYDAAYDAAYAAAYAADAAVAAAYAATAANAAAAADASLAQSADCVRAVIPWAMVEAGLRRLEVAS